MQLKFDPYQFEQMNVQGVPVYWKQIPWANEFVVIRVVMGVGSRQDPVGKEGLAHFFEHIPFNGCVGWPTLEEILGVSRSLLFKSLDARTGTEKTTFKAKTATPNLAQAMDFLGSFTFNPLLNDVERERKVIILEFWKRYGNPRQVALRKKAVNLLYGDHPLGRSASPIGWNDTIQTISYDDFFAFHRRSYVCENARVVIVGDIDEASVAKAMRGFMLNGLHGTRVVDPEPLQFCVNPTQAELLVSASEYFGLSGESIPKKTQIGVSRIFPIQPNEGVPALARVLIGELLFSEIRGKLGAAYAPSIQGNAYRDHCQAEISVEIAPEMLPTVRRIITGVIEEVAEGNRKHRELFGQLKQADLERITSRDQNLSSIADTTVDELANTGRIKSSVEDYESTSQVTYGDVASFVAREMRPEQLFWFIMTP